MKVIKEEYKVLGLLMIDDDLFTYDTPLGTSFNEFNRLSRMDEDLFTYDVKIPELSYSLSVEQQMDNLYNGNLDVYERKLYYNECEKIYVEAVIFIEKRLVRLIDVIVEQWIDLKYGDHTMKQKEVYGLNAGMEYDPSNVDFSTRLASKFSNYMMMDWYTKNALWIYWTRGDDEKVITDDELSNPREGKLIEETEIAKIFRIETDIFQFETSLCEVFREFNYLLKIDVDVANIPWLDYRPWMEPSDDIEHIFKSFRFKNGHVKWPTCNWKTEKYCNGGDLPRVIWNRYMIYFKNYEWYENLKEGELKDEDLNSKAIFEGSKGVDKESSNKGTNNDYKTQNDKGRFDEHELIEDDDDDIAKMNVIKEESEVLGLLMINDDLFTCDTPLGTIFNEFNRLSGMDDNLFTYECEKMYAKALIFVNKRLARLIDVTMEQWLDLKYGDHTIVSNEVKESVISMWLIQSYKKQFDEYMEIKKQNEVHRLDAGMEHDPSNVDFVERLASKFSKYMMMDWYTKNVLWINWTRRDDEEVITDDELSNLGDGNLIEENETAQIFRIDTDLFHFETPLCEAFKEFNYLLKIDVAVLTDNIPGFKTYDEYKDAWIYEWNKDNLEEGELKDEALNNKAIFKGSKGVDEGFSDDTRTHCSPNDEWEDFEHANYIRAYSNSNYNPYLDVSRMFNDHAGTNNHCETQKDEEWFDEHELMGDDDDDIGDLEDYLIQKDHPYYVNEEEERSKERICKLLRIPYVKPPTCKSEKFEEPSKRLNEFGGMLIF
ncbi:hypothetical protein Tco_0973193 [Tanacetum coccineum]